jgi:hypothetical protein
MSHFTRTNPDATWTNGGAGNYITLQSDWESLGTKAQKAINGDLGGAWAPTSPITIAGSGMTVSGPTIVDYNGSLTALAGAKFALNNNDYPKLTSDHVGNKRSILSDMLSYQCTPRYWFQDCPSYVGAIQSMACTILAPYQTTILENPSTHIDLRVHDGARLTDGVLTFRVPTLRYQLPVKMPRVRIVRVDTSGNIESLRAPSSGVEDPDTGLISGVVDVDGYSEIPRPLAGILWFNDGDAQAFAFTCDQKNTIDTSLYTYHLQIQEEAGTLDPGFTPSASDGASVRVRKSDVVYTFTAITFFTDTNASPVAQLGPYGKPISLPITINEGDVVLYNLPQTGTFSDLLRSMNGLWIVHYAGAWERVADVLNPSDLTPYFLVYDTNAKKFTEYTGPFQPSGSLHQTFFSNAPPGQHIASLSTYPQLFSDVTMNFAVRQPRGNIYHSVLLNFDSIFDMRPQ